MIISKQYIDTAINIRREFVNLNSKLDNILNDLKDVADKLGNENDNLKKINTDLGKFDKETSKDMIISKLLDMEKEANRLSKVYEPINDRIEQLKRDEENLYLNIKNKYPNLSDEEIVSEIRPFIEDIK